MALFNGEAIEDYQAQFTPLTVRYLILSGVLGAMLIYVLWYVGSFHAVFVSVVIILTFTTCLFTSRKRLIGMSVLTGLVLLIGSTYHETKHGMNHHFYGTCGPHIPHMEADHLNEILGMYLQDHGSYPLDGDELRVDGFVTVDGSCLHLSTNPFSAQRFRQEGYIDGKPAYRDELTGQRVSDEDYVRAQSIQPIPLGITDFNRNFRYVPTITETESGELVCLEYELIFYGRKFNYISPRLECEEVMRVTRKASDVK